MFQMNSLLVCLPVYRCVSWYSCLLMRCVIFDTPIIVEEYFIYYILLNFITVTVYLIF